MCLRRDWSIRISKKDLRTQDAVLRNLEILGEAIKLISEPIRKQYCDIPWSTVARLRDRLIHHYFGVNLDVVWDGKNRQGNVLPSGTYYYLMEYDGKTVKGWIQIR